MAVLFITGGMRHDQENIVADAEHTAHRFHGDRHICRLYAANKNAGLQGRLLRLRLLPYAGRERQALGLRLQDDAGALQSLQCTFSYVGYDKSASECEEMQRTGAPEIYTAARKTPEREQEFAFSTHPVITSSTCTTKSSPVTTRPMRHPRRTAAPPYLQRKIP